MTANDSRFKSSSAREAEEMRAKESDIGPSWRIQDWFSHLDSNTQDRLKKFFDELVRFNKTLNLVSPKTLNSADLVHFADSILGWNLIKGRVPNGNTVFDIGSGNGFPGLVISILSPEINVVAIDSDKRKCEFLKAAAHTLGLKNFSVQAESVESLGEKSIQWAVSRGFAPLSKAILSTRRVFKRNGIYFHMKSEEWASEVANIPMQLCSFWRPSLVGEYKLPSGQVKYAVVQTEKISD
jgi:16S rRNA (guanine527-N7)-methyltransferase